MISARQFQSRNLGSNARRHQSPMNNEKSTHPRYFSSGVPSIPPKTSHPKTIMKKTIAFLCFAVVAIALLWKAASLYMSISPSATSKTTRIIESDGAVKETVVEVKYVSVSNLHVAEGTQLIARNGTLETVGAGQFIASNPLMTTLNNIFWWMAVIMTFIAGISLYKKSEAPAEK